MRVRYDTQDSDLMAIEAVVRLPDSLLEHRSRGSYYETLQFAEQVHRPFFCWEGSSIDFYLLFLCFSCKLQRSEMMYHLCAIFHGPCMPGQTHIVYRSSSGSYYIIDYGFILGHIFVAFFMCHFCYPCEVAK